MNEGNTNSHSRSIQEIISPYVKNWKVIVCFLILCVGMGFLYCKVSANQYFTNAKILISDDNERQRGIGLDMSFLESFGLGRNTGSIDNEIEILRSRTINNKVIDSLNLNVRYLKKEGLETTELYKTNPIKFKVDNYSGVYALLTLDKKSNDTFIIKEKQSKFNTELHPGEVINSPWGMISIEPTMYGGDFPLFVELSRWSAEREVTISTVSKKSDMVEISMISPIPQKNEDIINSLIHFYNDQNISYKRWIGEETIKFLDDRLASMTVELGTIEKNVETYKKDNNLVDLQIEAPHFINSGWEYDQKIVEITVQKEILSSIEKYLMVEGNRYHALPSDLGITDIPLLSLIEKYNDLQLKRRESLRSMTAENPQIMEISNQIASLKEDIIQGIKYSEIAYNVTLDNLKVQEELFNSRIKNLPTKEREYREQKRKQELTESIYLFLLQKKEESAINLSIISPNAKVVDTAYTKISPVKPRKLVIMGTFFIIGLLLPLFLIYIRELLKTTISNKSDLKDLIDTPILGELPSHQKFIDFSGGRSGVIEKYSSIFTNLQYLMSDKRAEVISVTSSVAGEGKNVFAANMAGIFSSMGKKTLLVDLDMRNSRLSDILNLSGSKRGISSYVLDDKNLPGDIITDYSPNLAVAPAGATPANPLKVLTNNRIDKFFEYARENYDVVVVNTPSAYLVTDAVLIDRLCDMTLYVTRTYVTEREYIKAAEEFSRDKKLKNMAYVIMGIDINDNEYHYLTNNKKKNILTKFKLTGKA